MAIAMARTRARACPATPIRPSTHAGPANQPLPHTAEFTEVWQQAHQHITSSFEANPAQPGIAEREIWLLFARWSVVGAAGLLLLLLCIARPQGASWRRCTRSKLPDLALFRRWEQCLACTRFRPLLRDLETLPAIGCSLPHQISYPPRQAD
jgi:hypothetical protein